MAVAGVTVVPELVVMGCMSVLGGVCFLVWLMVSSVSVSVVKNPRPQPDKNLKHNQMANVSEVHNRHPQSSWDTISPTSETYRKQ